jgi:hypothetical protein
MIVVVFLYSPINMGHKWAQDGPRMGHMKMKRTQETMNYTYCEKIEYVLSPINKGPDDVSGPAVFMVGTVGFEPTTPAV